MPLSIPRPPISELRSRILQDVDLLDRRRAGEIADDYLDAYVGLGWLQWHGGGLRLTARGLSVCTEQSAALEASGGETSSG